MSAIRPLATIAMLMVLGYFLWTRINTPGLEQVEEPALASVDAPPLMADQQPAAEAAPAAGMAPLAPVTGNPAEGGEFSFGPAPVAGNTASGSETVTPIDTASMPELPPLPASIPTANYGGTADSAGVASDSSASATPLQPSASQISGSVPSLGTVVNDSNQPTPSAVASSEVPPPPAGTMDQSTIPAVPDFPGAAESDLGGESLAAGQPSAFAAARVAIDAALERGELERAHVLLTGWYGDETLTADQRDEVESLLSQLAGTVVYSQQHRLESPHVVLPGETLETIAQKYQVPWQLLAKINGVPEPSAVQPGQELKVLRGPFSAVVDVDRQQVALMVSERYAGRFNVKTEGQATSEGEWVVTQKQIPGGQNSQQGQVILEPASGYGSEKLVLGPSSDSEASQAGAIRVAPQDQTDLFDILSIGSKVIIRK